MRSCILLPSTLLAAGLLVHCVGDAPITTGGPDASQDVASPVDASANDGSPGMDSSMGEDASDAALAPLPITPTIALGFGFSCALRSNGTIWCWGWDSSGQLGNILTPTTTPNPTPGQVSFITTGATIGAGVDFVCALLTDHTVWCWGGNGTGQLGQTASANNSTPSAVAGLTNVIELGVGGSHVCARKSDNSVWCWGSNAENQLGYSNGTDKPCIAGIPCNPKPTQVAGLVADGVASGRGHTCARVGTTAKCWGGNNSGQLGHIPGNNGDVSKTNPTPTAAAATGVAAIFAGGDVSCMLDGATKVSCWGSDSTGQLGDMGTGLSAVPVVVPGLLPPGSQVAPGWLNSCAVSDTAAYCWGDNGYDEEGKAGSGTQAPGNPTGLANSVVQVASDMIAGHHCALKTTGDVLCWGQNGYDETGHSNTTDPACPASGKCTLNPTPVTGLP